MNAAEIAKFVRDALTESFLQKKTDVAPHPIYASPVLDAANFCISFTTYDGTKIKTYKITIAEEES